jgi:hypothetical protein
VVIYEVNLTINNEIFDEFYVWLIEHIELILKFKGFREADLAKEVMPENDITDKTKLTVRYLLDCKDDLDNYLAKHAPAMREDGVKKFGDKFSASRRIFTQL